MSEKPRILFVSNCSLDNGGLQAVVMNIARNLCSEYTFDILLFSDKESYHDKEFLSLGGEIFRLPEPKSVFWSKASYYLRSQKIYRKTLRILKTRGPYQAVHCHCHYEAGPCLAAAARAGVSSRVAHTHVIHSKAHLISRIYDFIYRELIEKHATHKLGCSKEACDSFYKDPGTAIVANNPYDDKKFFFGKHKAERLDAPHLVQIGSFSNRKNQLFSIDIVYWIKKEYPNVKFDMVGFEVEKILDTMKTKIKELDLENNITIHPCDADSTLLLAHSSGSLMPSTSEAFGIVAIEAQAMGVKCYASDVVPRTTDCGGCEYLPLSAGAEAWAKKIVEDFKATGGEHIKYDCSAFDAKNVIEEYRKIYCSQKP